MPKNPLRRSRAKSTTKPAAAKPAATKGESLEDLRTRARDEFGIANADQMTESQLKQEVKDLEAQPKTAESTEE